MKKALSIKDIAEKAGVSITTVSFIINGKAKEKAISAQVTKKVQAIISELGYQPSPLARGLRTGNTNIIGLIVEDIANPFFAEIAKILEQKAYERGYKIIYSSTENDINKAKDLINVFKSRKVDAYIISPVKGIEDDIQLLLKDQQTVVLFDRNLQGLEVDYVGVDNFRASKEATQHLLSRNRKQIALVTIDLPNKQITDRLDGYKQALTEADLFNDNLIMKVPFGQSEAETATQIKALFVNQKIDAVLFATNYLAIHSLNVFRESGMDLTKMDLIAYDDHVVFKLLSPQISAVAQPLEDIAEQIISLVLESLSSKGKNEPRQVILPATLVLRN
ncbi:MAG: LacI family transcriptional regulator [Pedobacter sp.]|nr:MAG: LacI family transcriptional regulator [Pedobacter sp.]